MSCGLLIWNTRAIRILSTVMTIASGLASSLNPSVERSNPPIDKWRLIPWVKFYIDISRQGGEFVDTEHGDWGYKY